MQCIFKKKDNGTSYVHITQSGIGVIDPKGARKFKYRKQNMFINELKINKKIENNIRKFVLCIRLDGNLEYEGQYRSSQMIFNDKELRELRNNIDLILNSKQ